MIKQTLKINDGTQLYTTSSKIFIWLIMICYVFKTDRVSRYVLYQGHNDSSVNKRSIHLVTIFHIITFSEEVCYIMTCFVKYCTVVFIKDSLFSKGIQATTSIDSRCLLKWPFFSG